MGMNGNGAVPGRNAGSTPAPARREPLRRAIDVVLSLVLLAAALPVLLAAALAVLLTSGRPVFYAHVRVGRHRRPFRCWKLRTMEVGAESRLRTDPSLGQRYRQNGFKLPPGEDPRVTRVGRFLRRTYIDELPQLFNVLAGSMSLVGPRPVIEEELQEFAPEVSLLLELRPGIFGAWTSRGDHRPPYPERARLELEYARNRTLRGDIAILVRSLPVVVRGYHNGA